MTVYTRIVPCIDTLTRALLEDMAYIWRSALYSSDDERLDALRTNYEFNQFVKGRFYYQDDVIVFDGELGTGATKCKTEAKVEK